MKLIAPNTLLQNRYLVGELIGKGGMGEVYLANDQRLGNYVALKRTFFTDDELLSGAFEREAKMLANLRHNVLPKVIDHFTESGEQFLVMEYIGGDDLSKRLSLTKTAFPVNWVLFWADELLDALAYLHAHNPPIVHRDIKPQNLKLTNDNHIILLDFGLAKNTSGQTRVSTAGSLVGYTPHYAPIEQIRGTGTNSRSDIFSLSATLYQLFTNTVPIAALSRADVILGGKTDPLRPLSEVNPDVSQLLSNVILKGMSLNQEQRFANAREMQKALRDAYSQMQELATAQTVAFNIEDDKKAQISVPFDSNAQKTEELVIPSQPQSFEKTEVMNFVETPKQDFEATMRMDSFPTPIEEKTEIFADIPKQEEKTEVYLGVPNEPSEINFDQTMPVIATNETSTQWVPPASPFDNTDSFEIIEPTPFVEKVSEPPQEVVYDSTPIVQPQPKKSSNGKLIGILVGLFSVGLLVVGGVLGGVYYYQNYANVTPKPTPEVKKSVEPTPNPSPSVTSNSNTSNTNKEVITAAPTPTTDSTPEKQDTKPTPTTDKPNQTPLPTPVKTATPTQATPKPVATPKPLATSKPIATPKPTKPPTGGRKDDIEQ